MTTREPYRAQRVGNLRERVTLMEWRSGRDEWNNPIEGWFDVETVYARVEPLKGQERLIANEIVASYDVLVHIRAYPGMSTTWRVKHEGRELEIRAIQNLDERGRYLTLECAGTAP